MIQYIDQVWNCRLFWLSVAYLDLRKRYRRSLLGFAWAVVQPVVMALVVCGIFSGAFQVDFQTHFPFTLVGLAFWGYITSVVQQGCGCIYWSETYLRQHRAPMAIYPLRIVLPALFHLLLILVPVWLWTSVQGGAPFVASLSLLPTLLLLLILGWSLATVCGFITVYFSDMRSITEVSLQVLFYATPVVYHPRLLRDRGLQWLLELNPFAALVELVRQPMLGGSLPAAPAIALALFWVLLAFLGATLVLSTLERRIIFEL